MGYDYVVNVKGVTSGLQLRKIVLFSTICCGKYIFPKLSYLTMKDSSFVLLNTHLEVGLQVSRDQEDNNDSEEDKQGNNDQRRGQERQQ